jgi:hypothetical protein
MSNGLNRRAVVGLKDAIDFAPLVGTPLNTHVIVAWELAGVVGRVQQAQTHYCENMRKWMARRDTPAAYAWVLERGWKLGVHAHLVVHVPGPLGGECYEAFTRKSNDWAKQAGAEILRGGTCRTVVCKIARNPETLHRYLAEGVTADDAAWAKEKYSIDRVDQGSIMGRRAQLSTHIGPAAREAYYARQTDLAA